MKKLTFLTLSSLSLVAVVTSLIVPAMPVAALTLTNTGGQALEIGPPVMNLSGNPGQTIKAMISLRDISSGSLLVNGQVNDFIANGEDGTPKILLDSTTTSPYSFKSWVSPLSELTLKSKEIRNLPITISIPAHAAPGGYYGVIRFTATPPDLKNTGVSLSASLGSLVLLTVNGTAKENMSIEAFSVNHDGKTASLFESAPLQFVERLHNTGNIHERPTGLVTITDMFHHTLATLSVNQPPHDILPQSIRKFEQPLDSTVIGNKMLFGRYQATLSVTYGANKKVITSTMTFWVIPYTLIAIGIVILVGGFIGLRFLIQRYNRHIIRKAQK
jgi:hypothetical protein